MNFDEAREPLPAPIVGLKIQCEWSDKICPSIAIKHNNGWLFGQYPAVMASLENPLAALSTTLEAASKSVASQR